MNTLAGLSRLSALLTCLFVLALAQATTDATAKNKLVGAEIRAIIEGGQETAGNDDEDERLIQVMIYYESRSFKPIWVRDNGPKTKGKRLLLFLQNAEAHGLVASDYRVNEITELIEKTDHRSLAELDLLMSRAMIDFGRDLNSGRVDPAKFNREITIYPQRLGATTLLDGSEAADNIEPYLESLAPESPRYARLKQKLAEYRALDKAGGFIEIPAGETLKPDMEDPRIDTLRKRLIQMGDLEEGAHSGDVYDGALVDGVKNFQYRHGIDQDGVIGPATLAEFNTAIDARIETLELNMERRRWMPPSFGDFYVFINLADQFLKVVKDEKTIHTALLVVGKPFHRTPVFSETMKYIVFNPYWKVPYSIATKEYLPKLKRDAGVLERQNIRVMSGNNIISPYSVDWASYSRKNFPFRLRQDPGPKNALGRVKFMFPNKHNVYLHDTAARSLFAKSFRALSHGCVRLGEPIAFADEVLASMPGWSRDRIDDVLASQETTRVSLKSALPVHLVYETAWLGEDGTIHFRPDIYSRDKRLHNAIFAKHTP